MKRQGHGPPNLGPATSVSVLCGHFLKPLIFHDLSWFSGPLPFHCGISELHFTYFNSLSDGKEQLNDGDVSITFTNDHTYKVCLT